MAVYTPDFSAMTTGQQVAGFTKRFRASFSWPIAEKAGTPWGKVIACPQEASSLRNFISYDALNNDPARDTGETFFQFTTPATASMATAAIYCLYYGSGAGYAEDGLRLGADIKDSEVNGITYNGGATGVGTGGAFTFVAETTYNFLVKVVGDDHEMYCWQEGDAEPATPTYTYNNAKTNTENWRGLFRFETAPVDITFVSFSTGTDVADRGPTSTPTVTLTGDLQPGSSFTLTYSNYATTPTSPVTMTDSNGNAITVAVTIDDVAGTATGTMPALPTTGTAAGLLFGNVTVELS